jgi:hypothetical protein
LDTAVVHVDVARTIGMNVYRMNDATCGGEDVDKRWVARYIEGWRIRPMLPRNWGLTGIIGVVAAAPALGQWQAISLHTPEMVWSQALGTWGSSQVGYGLHGPLARIQPFLWSSSSSSWISLAPLPSDSGIAYAAWGNQQGGQLNGRASVWSGSAASHVDLHPSFALASEVFGMKEGQQVGTTWNGQNLHAALWTGSATSAVSLHPTAQMRSFARATDGTLQGGSIFNQTEGYQAVIWAGSVQSMVNLTPEPNRMGEVQGMVPGQQVGYAQIIGSSMRAALWSGTPESFVDLHPPGAGLSRAYATIGSVQAGYANTAAYGITAGIWFGTAESFFPLAPFMPPGYGQSVAYSISEHDGFYYIGGRARGPSGQDEAFLWIGPVPSPGVLPVFAFASAYVARRRRR